MKRKSLLVVSALMAICLAVGFGIGLYAFQKQLPCTGKVVVEQANAKIVYFGDTAPLASLDFGGSCEKNSEYIILLDIISLATLQEGEFDIVSTSFSSISGPADLELTVEGFVGGGTLKWKVLTSTDTAAYPIVAWWGTSDFDIRLGPGESYSDYLPAVANAVYYITGTSGPYPSGHVVQGAVDGSLAVVVHTNTMGGDYSFTLTFGFEQPAG